MSAAPVPARPDLGALQLVLHVTDPDVRAELERHDAGRARHDFALDALRIGILALRQAQGRIDADHVSDAVEELLVAQRASFLKELSLDNRDGALRRLVTEVSEHNGRLRTDLRDRIADLVRELLGAFDGEREESEKFRRDVRDTLVALAARRQEASRSTRHGHEFEAAVHEFVRDRASRTGDVATRIGATAGRIHRCKVGDSVVELGRDHVAAGARIAIEAKEREHVSLADALAEIAKARENRDAQAGVFVYSARVAPEGTESFARHGNDVVVVWDHEDPATDVWLVAGLEVARALCVTAAEGSDGRAADVEALETAILAVEQQAEGLDEIERSASTVRSGGQKILDRVNRMRDGLGRQIEILRENFERLKETENGPPAKRRRNTPRLLST